MKLQHQCAAAQQRGAGGGGEPMAGWQGDAPGLLVFPCSHGTAPTARCAGKSRLPVSTVAQSGHWLQAGASVSPLQHPPQGKRQPHRAKTSPGCTMGVGGGGGKTCPLKRGNGCTGAPAPRALLHLCPERMVQLPRQPPFAVSCPSGAGHRPGPPSLRHCRASSLHRARSHVLVGCHGAAGHGDAHPAMGMLTPLQANPLLPKFSSPAGCRQCRKSV